MLENKDVIIPSLQKLRLSIILKEQHLSSLPYELVAFTS